MDVQPPQSLFLREFPLEIRKLIYDYVWSSGSRDYHIYQRDGHLFHARCVMAPVDEDLDLIQKEMDRVFDSPNMDTLKHSSLRMWYRRLSGRSWGRRHWRCEERLDFARCKYGDLSQFDDTHWMSLLLVCPQMYHEVLASVLEYHNFIISDLTSAHWFLVRQPPPLWRHIRHLDLTLGAPAFDYCSFLEDGDASQATRLSLVLEVLKRFNCLHDVRISFDMWNLEKWTEISEEALLSHVKSLHVLKNLTIELPPSSPNGEHEVKQQAKRECVLQVQRRPGLRYQLIPGISPMAQKILRINRGMPKNMVGQDSGSILTA